MSNEVLNPYQQFLDATGNVLENGTLTFNVNLTSTLDTVYADEALTVAQSNPYTLDAAGRMTGDVRFTGKKRMVIKDQDGATVRTLDYVVSATDVDSNLDSYTKTYATVAAMKADTILALGRPVRWLEHTATYGFEGGNIGLVVAAGTGTDDDGSYFDLNNGLQVQALFPNGVNIKQFGHSDSTASTFGSALKRALAAVDAGAVIDCRDLSGTHTFDVDCWSDIGDKPTTILFGPYTIEADISSDIQQIVPPYTKLVFHGTTVQPSAAGQFPTFGKIKGFWNTKVYETTGTITASNSSLEVADATGIYPGSLVAIDGADTEDSDQQNTLNGNITASTTSITLTDASGFETGGLQATLLIGTELITYTNISGNDLTGVVRGVYGTTAASHLSGANVTLVPKRLARVVSVSGTTITIDRVANKSVTSAVVEVGSVGVSFEGEADFDGRQNRGGADSGNLFGIEATLASRMYVDQGIVVRGWDFSGINLRAAWDNKINAETLYSNGRPDDSNGWSIGLLSRSNYNTVRVGLIRDGHVGIAIEDRSSTVDRGYVGQSDNNTVYIGQIDEHNNGLTLAGSDNSVIIGQCPTSVLAVALNGSSTQWTTAKTPSRNNVMILGQAGGDTDWCDLESEVAGGQNVIYAAFTAKSITNQTGNSVGFGLNVSSLDSAVIQGQSLRFRDAATNLGDGAAVAQIVAEIADSGNEGDAAKIEGVAEGTVGRVGWHITTGKVGSQLKTRMDSFGNFVMPISVSSPTLTNEAAFVVRDVSSTAEMFARDEAGNETQLSPHGFPLIPGGPSEDMAWSYYSEREGKAINVDMLRALRLLESLTGETLVYEGAAIERKEGE